MANATVYFDYHEGVKVPIWYVVEFDTEDLYQEYLYIPIKAPFQPLLEFEEKIGISILLSDLTVHEAMPNHIGIYLDNIKNRVEEHGIDLFEIKQFIIQMADIEDVLLMRPNRSFLMEGWEK